MNNYIVYLDLIGIKDLAKYSSARYFMAMENFRERLMLSASIFNEEGNSKESRIYFFSDSAFIESDDIETVFKYLINLRFELNLQDLFFTAAITVGNLEARTYSGQKTYKDFDDRTKRALEGKEIYLNGIIFQSKDISNVYVLQNNFKGIGVYIHEAVFEKWKTDLVFKFTRNNPKLSSNEIFEKAQDEFKSLKSKYISTSFFFPSINTNSAYIYNDLKLTEHEMDINLYTSLLSRYHNSNVKNKKYGRFFLTHLANWISSSDFSKMVLNPNDNGNTFDNAPEIINQLIVNENILLSSLKRTAHCFSYLYFFLLENLYSAFKQEYNQVISMIIEVIIKNQKCKGHLTRIDEIPNCVLSLQSKDLFINDYNRMLMVLNTKRDKEKQKKEEERQNKSKNKEGMVTK